MDALPPLPTTVLPQEQLLAQTGKLCTTQLQRTVGWHPLDLCGVVAPNRSPVFSAVSVFGPLCPHQGETLALVPAKVENDGLQTLGFQTDV